MPINKYRLGSSLLLTVAFIAVTAAVSHMSCIALGPNCFRAQLAPELIVNSAVNGTWIAPIGTLLVSALFILCATYAISAAKLIKPMPMLRLGIYVISGMCLLRGIGTVPIAISYSDKMPTFAIVAGLIWFFSGLMCVIGYALVGKSA